jgi:hypothetical protein
MMRKGTSKLSIPEAETEAHKGATTGTYTRFSRTAKRKIARKMKMIIIPNYRLH